MTKEKSYSEKLKSPKWQKKRLKILERDKWMCVKCKDDETELHVHHLKYKKNPWDVANKDLVTLCKDCHCSIERLKDDNEFKNIPIHEISIHKSNCWEDRTIMFVAVGGFVDMSIYDKKNEFIIGFNIPYRESKKIAELMNKLQPF